jgi:hypothetical protein
MKRGNVRMNIANHTHRVLFGSALACVLAGNGTEVFAAPSADVPGSASAEDTALARLLRVEVDLAIEDAPLIPAWVAARSSHLVEALSGPDGQEHRLVVEIRGGTYDYRVSVVALRNGKLVAASGPTRCECTNEELLALVDDEIAEVVGSLHEAPPEQPAGAASDPPAPHSASSTVEPVGPGHGDRRDRIDHRPLGSLGYTGIGIGVVGIGMMAGGIPLALQHDQIRGEPGAIMTRSPHDAGIGLSVAGGIALAGGVAIIVVDAIRARKRAITVAPTGARRHVGVMLTWKF